MMKKFLLVIFIFGCGISNPELIDGSTDIDSGVSTQVNDRPCRPDALDVDFFNCGHCGFQCPPEDSDHCESMSCRCGTSLSCGDGFGCRNGRCIPSDTEGDDTCEFDRDCDVNSACIEGYCSFVECTPEVCDGIDNDCDGIIDGTLGGPLAEWCYSTPGVDPSMINYPCSPGVRVCSEGSWTSCQGEIPPRDEIGLLACDRIDNNCDLCIDGDLVDGYCVDSTISGFDVVFLIDRSGSMSIFNDAVEEAIRTFSMFFDRPNFRFATVMIPGMRDGSVELRQDFLGYEDYIESFVFPSDRVISSEPSYDGVFSVGINDLGLSFSPEYARIIVMFTDEGGQSFRRPAITETMMCDSLSNGEVFVVFERDSPHEDFDMCATHSFVLSESSEDMAILLRDVISDPCER